MTATIAPVAAVTSLVGADWAAMTAAAAGATTVGEVDRTVLRLVDGSAVDLPLHARRALFALCRVPPGSWRPSGPHDAYGFSLAADPLVRSARVGGHGATVGEIALAGAPGSLTVEIDWPAGGRGRVYVDSVSGQWLCTLIVHGPPQAVDEPLPTGANGAEITAAIVERIRVRKLPGRRPPGRPPAPTTTLAAMDRFDRMAVACELVEIAGYDQKQAATYCGVTRGGLTRALSRRRLERLALPK